MIKFSSLRFPLHFSTIRYPDYAIKAFHLNKSIRTCLSLSELQNYIKEHDQQIKKYGKTTILEYFNEFPLSFIYKSKDSSLIVYQYALGLTDLNIYEEQLKQGALIKYHEYSVWEGARWKSIIDKHEKQLEMKIEKTPFDIVDSFNWIIIKRSLKCNKLFFHAINIISEIAKEDYSYKYSRLLPIVLKRMEELEWSSLRDCKKLFKFVCYEFKLSIETFKQITSIIERFAELKLHAVGYTRVPAALDDAYSMIQKNVNDIGSQSLLAAFESFIHLPIYYNPKAYIGLFSSICSRLQKQPVYIQMLPLCRMTEREIDIIAHATFCKEFNIINCIYFINMLNGKVLLRSEYFVKKLQQVFFGYMKKKHQILRNDHQAVICTARALVQFYYSNPEKIERIHNTLKQIHDHFLTELRERDVINMASLQNQLTYVHFDTEIKLMKNSKDFYRMIDESIACFTHRKMYSTWKIRKHYAQIVEALAIFSNTKHKKILAYFNEIIRKQIQINEDFNQSFVMEYIFYLQKSKNHEFFEKTIDHFYKNFEKNKFLAMAEVYISKFHFKTAKGTEQLILKMYENHKSFIPIGKIIAGVPPILLADLQFSMNKNISQILNQINFNQKTQMLSEFNLLQITSMLNVCLAFFEDLQIFTKNLLDFLSATLQKQYKEWSKYVSLEDQVFFFKAIENMRRYIKNNFHRQFFGQFKVIEEQIRQNIKLADIIEIEKIETQIYKSFDKEKELKLLQPKIQQIFARNIKNEDKSGILIKLSLFLFLERNICHSCKQYETNILNDIKNAFRTYQLNLNELRIFLHQNYYSRIEKKKIRQNANTRDIILYAFQIDCKQDRTTYLYFMRLGHLLELKQVVETCMKELLILNLEPFEFVEVLRIAEKQKIKLDNKMFEHLDHKEIFELLYTLSVKGIDLKPYLQENSILKSSFLENQNILLYEIENPKKGQNEKKKLSQKLFKYYHIAIQNNLINKYTFELFKFNIDFFDQLSAFLKSNTQQEEYYMFLYLFLQYEKIPLEDLVKIKEREKYIIVEKQSKSSFFSVKSNASPNIMMTAKTPAEESLNLKRQQDKLAMKILRIKQSLFKNPPMQSKNDLFQSILKSQGIKPRNVTSKANKYFESMYTCGNITLSIFIQDSEKRYGIIYYFDKNFKQRKPIIIEKILSEFVGFPVMAINTFNPRFTLPN